MHIIISAIAALAGLFWALNRLSEAGFNLNSLNPFLWARRRRWEKQYGTKPIHGLTEPVEVVAVLACGIASFESGITTDAKQRLQQLFAAEFQLSEAQSEALYSASMHLLKDTDNLAGEVRLILKPTLASFSAQQHLRMMELLQQVAALESPASKAQQEVIEQVKAQFQRRANTGNWPS
ncbi:MAG: phenylacetic acid degradation protein [Gammaproteobacteria bacterium]|nr:phenylacetic acid degradation protein [Gammaproteobacteria bacterium]NVK89135.1 phenylacetic acid degradation protein [Gammaproteobacteria bacterium]